MSDNKTARLHLLKRLLLALATGNGDLHLENRTIINRDGTLSFSPVYDPTPMRAYSIHNMLTVMHFGRYGEVHLKEALLLFAANLGFRKKQLTGLIEEVLSVTGNYRERIQALKKMPDANKKNLIKIVKAMKTDLGAIK